MAVRPTLDRVREAIFNALYSLDAVDGATVLDLFAGSGALGIEALSRGAAHVTFVERDPTALAAISGNLAATGLRDRADLVRADVMTWLPSAPALDLVLADPPYEFDAWPDVLAAVRARIVVAESDREVGAPPGWEVRRSRRYGTTVVTLLAAAGGPAADPVTDDPTDDQEAAP